MNKHTTNLVILFFLAAVTIAFSGCNGVFNSSVPHYTLSQTMKDYCYFNKGSVWVYQNDTTGVTDSLAVGDINSYIAFHAADNKSSSAFNYDVVEMIYTGNQLKIGSSSMYAGPPEANGQGGLYRIFYNDSSFLLAFAPGYKIGDSQLLGGYEGVFTNIDSTVTLSFNGFNFSDVYHTQEKVALTEGDTTQYEFYFAPHYGLVRWTKTHQNTTQSYSLKSADLKQN